MEASFSDTDITIVDSESELDTFETLLRVTVADAAGVALASAQIYEYAAGSLVASMLIGFGDSDEFSAASSSSLGTTLASALGARMSAYGTVSVSVVFVQPTGSPSWAPSLAPSTTPTATPTITPTTTTPTSAPTASPTTSTPTQPPTRAPTETDSPTAVGTTLVTTVESTITFALLDYPFLDAAFQATFTASFQRLMAAAAGTDTDAVAVTAISAGSTVVTSVVSFSLSGAAGTFTALVASDMASIFAGDPTFSMYGAGFSSTTLTTVVILAPSNPLPPSPPSSPVRYIAGWR